MLRVALRKIWRDRVITPLSLEQSLASFKGAKQKLYQRAYQSLRIEPLCRRDGRIKAFVKAEKFNPADKVNPDPRMIQARDPRYNLHLARFLRPLEHVVYGVRSKSGLPMIVKCMNPKQRAALILEKWRMFDNPVCVSLDCSRWDKHVGPEILKVEHDFYRSWFPGEPELDMLLRWQMVNDCRTSNGVKYQVVGGRMSGDMNTALGNCTLMVGMVHAAMRKLRVKKFEVVDDGDDILVMVEHSDLALLVERLPGIFLEFGQELKVENIATCYNQITFCQSRPVWNGEEHTMVRNWAKVLSQSCCGTKHWNDPNLVPGMFGLLGDCEMAQHRGIPIIQAFAARLRELSQGKRSSMIHLDSSYQYRVSSYDLGDIRGIQPTAISDQSRIEFEQAYCVDPSTQIAIEEAISRWNPDIVLRDVGMELSGFDWDQKLDPGIPSPTVL